MKKSIILFAAVLVLLTGCAKQSAPTEAPTEFASEVAETIQSSLTAASEKVTAALEQINAAEADDKYNVIQEVAASLDEAKEAYVNAAEACADNEALAELKASIETAIAEYPENLPLDIEFGIKKYVKAVTAFATAQGDCAEKAAAVFAQ